MQEHDPKSTGKNAPARQSSHRTRLGRPRDDAKATAILDRGWALFLAHGIEATSIEAIARAAGVSKVTLYSHFPDKAALFEAAVLREMERIEAAQMVGPDEADQLSLEERLNRFGLGLMRFLVSKPAVDFYVAIAGELRRHAVLARAFYDLGPGRSRTNLTALLATACETGEIAGIDPAHGADQLFGLWQGFFHYRVMLGIDLAEIEAGLENRVRRGTAAFLSLYGRD